MSRNDRQQCQEMIVNNVKKCSIEVLVHNVNDLANRYQLTNLGISDVICLRSLYFLKLLNLLT